MKYSSRPGPNRWKLLSIGSTGLLELTAFSFVINILLLVQPLYMLQVYDRVLVSASVDTLLMISNIAAIALGLLGALDALRCAIGARSWQGSMPHAAAAP